MALFTLFPYSASGQESKFQSEAIKRLLVAFNTNDLVALSDHHGSKVDSDLRIGLVRHPGFPKKANAIVVEFGNALYQPILDRYIAGQDVPSEELRQVWLIFYSLGWTFAATH